MLVQVEYVTISQLISRYCSPSQLTLEFGGTLPYNHEQWVSNRLVSNHFRIIVSKQLDRQ